MRLDIKTFLKGMAMGAADVVPGVSGGTIAFITGIYDQLLESIRRINPSLIGRIRREGFKAAWNHINAPFLITLMAGIGLAIATLAKLISHLLATQPIAIWSFFFGLILVSILHISKQIDRWDPPQLLSLAIGIGLAWILSVANPLALDPTPMNILIGGMIAICAMILPGISGSFILLLLGLYGPVLAAVSQRDLVTIAIFLSGTVLGLLSFSHLLSFLLRRFHTQTLAFLTGLLIGTLGKIWPWKQTLSWRTNSKGEQVPLLQENLLPGQFEQATGDSNQLLLALSCAAAGFLLVLILEKLGEREG
ncbi:DUF368 domain-containing protein [Ferrimonas sediminicola]|uniref:DUF368 domain-containing protein n=1 Tax=Ferrimonas sediminicola TaxID=2569538 RepID=A0A4U1BBZ4_9GAMM|nr:DUF368 domain-containing protein [Ferrimonas sediminicola]TKB48462.1 DUF368 domain-containing protein [Ferrimonas sediminicola]